MQYIKSWKLFESLDKESQFANPDVILDIFLELHDDGVISKCEWMDSGYLFFPEFWSRKIKSELYLQMISKPDDWEKGKPEELMGGTWQELFLDTTADERLLKRKYEYLWFGDVEHSVSNIRNSGVYHKAFDQLFIENIELGKITAYPVMLFSLGRIDINSVEVFFDTIKRVHRATGFRPIKGFWNEDFVENDEVVTTYNAELQFVKVSDSEYKNLVHKLPENGLERDWLPKLGL